MKIFLFFCCTISFALSPEDGLAQDANIRIEKDETLTLNKAFTMVNRQTDYKFVYRHDLLKNAPKIAVTKGVIKTRVLLAKFLSPINFTYEFTPDNTIVVKRKPENNKKRTKDETSIDFVQQSISGSVQDSNGLPLAGANVLEMGTTNGTQTDFDGNFSLTVSSENAVLSISFLGFVTKEISVKGRETLSISLEEDAAALDEVVVVGYGTQKKSDVTGATERLDVKDFQNQNVTQLTDLLTGTVAGFNASQSGSAGGVGSLQVRGPTSLTAGTDPLLVVDGAIFKGSLQDINPNDIETIDVLKDASSAAVYGSKAASGVILVTTKKGVTGKPTINLTTRWGMVRSTNERKGLDADEYVQFRQDYFRTTNPNMPFHFYTNPDELPDNVSLEDWRAFGDNPLDDNTQEYLSRLRFFPIEQQNYLADRTVDWYDVVMRRGLTQTHDISLGGGTEDYKYYWSVGYTDKEGIIVGDEFSNVRSRINVDFDVTDWLTVGMNTMVSSQDESAIPASLGFYSNSPYGQVFDDEGNLARLPHGHTFNPLLEPYRQDRLRKVNTLFSKIYANIKLPFGITYNGSFQPRYEFMKDLRFTTTDPRRGGDPSQDQSFGSRSEYSHYEWMIDNILRWDGEFGVHAFDVTLLQNLESTRRWSSFSSNRNFAPTEQLGYNALQLGNAPSVSNDDYKYTGDALMARLNYTLMERYLFTGSIRRDGYSAFGLENPRADFPALAVGWIISKEDFFKVEAINRMKLRLSWGVNGNRDIGIYAALARLEPEVWFDGSNPRIGVYNSTLGNRDLRWERTESFNVGLDIGLFKNKVDLSLNYYDMVTTDLLLNRRLPALTGFSSITSNLGKLRNRGFEMSLDAAVVNKEDFSWRTNLVFSMNRNKIVELFGDVGEYTLLGEERTGEVPDYSNQWFPGKALDVVWDYDITGVWQENEREEAESYNMRVGDFKAVDLNEDGEYDEFSDKKFIGHTVPRFRLGFRNSFSFLKNFTASIFIRADLGHIGEFSDALNPGWESNDRRNRNVGPVPYWTPENPINDYARLDVSTSGYGGDLRIFKSRSFVRIQDVTLGYNLPSATANRLKLSNVRVFSSVRNMATFTKWPGWDPESGDIPLPASYNVGLSLSL